MSDLHGLAVAGKLAQNCAPLVTGAQFIPSVHALHEPKMDGWRLLVFRGEDKTHLFSRSGIAYTGQLPTIEQEVFEQFPAGTWLDGEACTYTPEDGGKVSVKWSAVQKVLTNKKLTMTGSTMEAAIVFMVFDLIAHRDIDARTLPFATRRSLLERIFDKGTFDRLRLIPQYECGTIQDFEARHQTFIDAGFEGSVVKSPSVPYASNQRGAGWTKIKPVSTIEGVIMGFTDSKAGTGLIGSVEFGQYDETNQDDPTLIKRGKCSGMDMKTRKSMTEHPEQWVGRVIEVKHEGVDIGGTGTKSLRFPRYVRVRDDKLASQVTYHDA